MVETEVKYLAIGLLPREERLAVVVEVPKLRKLVSMPTGTYDLLSADEARVVPYVALPDHVREELVAFGHSLLDERPLTEVTAEIRFLRDPVGSLLWVRIDRNGLGILLEAALDPEVV